MLTYKTSNNILVEFIGDRVAFDDGVANALSLPIDDLLEIVGRFNKEYRPEKINDQKSNL